MNDRPTQTAPRRSSLGRAGRVVIVQARPPYRATVEWESDHPGGKVTVRPIPGQGVTDRARTVWKDKISNAEQS
jgi:hypothetical protein